MAIPIYNGCCNTCKWFIDESRETGFAGCDNDYITEDEYDTFCVDGQPECPHYEARFAPPPPRPSRTQYRKNLHASLDTVYGYAWVESLLNAEAY